MTHRVLLLGDSCILNAGSGFSFADRLSVQLGAGWLIVNHSVPGATSRTIRNHIRRIDGEGMWDLVVVYLGNVDGYGRHIGRSVAKVNSSRVFSRILGTARLRQNYKSTVSQTSPRTDPVNTKINFIPKYVSDLPVDISEFSKNISELLDWTAHVSRSTVVIIPCANKEYPASMMHPNAPFARLYGLAAVPASWMNATDNVGMRFIAAAKAWEEENFGEAEACYTELIKTKCDWTGLAANNLGVLYLENNAFEFGLRWLECLGDDKSLPFSATAVYNIARLHLSQRNGPPEISLSTLVDSDAYLYRISSEYKDVLVNECSYHDRVTVIDLNDLLEGSQFVDYCHPTPDQLAHIAAAVGNRWKPVSSRYSEPAVIETYMPALNINGCASNFLKEIGCNEITHTDREIWTNLAERCFALGNKNFVEPIEMKAGALQNILIWCRHHPLYQSDIDLEIFSRYFVHGCSRFPELIFDNLYRHSLQLLARNSREVCSDIYDAITYWNYSEENFRTRIEIFDHSVMPIPGGRYLSTSPVAVANATINRLRYWTHLFSPQLGPRLLTTRYWYLREAFRFGSWSRLTMLYPYWELEYLAHSLIYAIIVATPEQRTYAEGIARELLALLREIDQTHAELTTAAVKNHYMLVQKTSSQLKSIVKRIPTVKKLDSDGKSSSGTC
jgi:hypothetical protein